MKTLILIRPMIITMAMGILFSCSERDEILDTFDETQAVLKSTTVESGTVFLISPTNTDDTYNIENALNDAADSPGSTVKFTEGTFYLSHRIEIEGFDGYIIGAGKDKTIITQTPGEKINLIDLDNAFTAVLKFRLGNIRVSDLTFYFSDPEPAGKQNVPPDYPPEYWENALQTVIYITGNSVTDLPGLPADNQFVSSSFDNVGFIGADGNFLGYNIVHFVIIEPEWSMPPEYLKLDGGNHKFTNCEFRSSCVPLNVILANNGTVTVGGSPKDGNKFENICYGPYFEDVSNLNIEVSHNDITDMLWVGSSVDQGNYVDPSSLDLSKVLIHDNNYEVKGICDAIWIDDYGYLSGTQKIDINIYNNKMNLETDQGSGGIFSYYAMDGLITNNKISGNGVYGIFCWYCSGLLMKGNNVQNLNAAFAPIVLYDDADNCMVVGGMNKTNVLDWGTNNILSGVNNMDTDPIGPEIHDAMMHKKDLMKTFR